MSTPRASAAGWHKAELEAMLKVWSLCVRGLVKTYPDLCAAAFVATLNERGPMVRCRFFARARRYMDEKTYYAFARAASRIAKCPKDAKAIPYKTLLLRAVYYFKVMARRVLHEPLYAGDLQDVQGARRSQ